MIRAKIGKRWRAVCALLFWAFAAATSADNTFSSDTLTLGVFPRRNMAETVAFYTPMANYLARQLKRPVVVVSAKDFADFWRGVEERRYDIVHYNQYHYVKSHRRLGYDAIVKIEENGSDKVASVIVAHADSGIRDLRALRGRTIVFGGGRDAMHSYILPTFLLRKAGLRAGDYTEKFARNPPNAILTLDAEQADAVGTTAPCIRETTVDHSNFISLAHSMPVAQLPFAVKHEMSPILRAKIQGLLVNLKNTDEGRAILNTARLSGMANANDAEYNLHREIIYQTLGERY